MMAVEYPIRTECPICGSNRLSPHNEQRFFCLDCRTAFLRRPRPCIICNTPIPHGHNRSNTCSDDCRKIRKRNREIEHYYRKTAQDPLHNHKKHEKRKHLPNFAKAAQDREVRRWQRIKQDTDQRENQQERQRQYYRDHAKKIWEKRRAAMETLSPEEVAKKIKRDRLHSRESQARRSALRKLDPDAQQKYLDAQAEYRRKRALAGLAELGAELEHKLTDGGNSNDNNN